MKTDIHPTYGDTTVTCSCGNTFVTRSAKPGSMHIELCNECHPFYTGRQKLVDAGGRVERFQKRYAGSAVKSKKRQKAEADETAADPAGDETPAAE